MVTVTNFETLISSEIRLSNRPGSIQWVDMRYLLKNIVYEIRDRGFLKAADTAALATISHTNTDNVLVENVGFFKAYESVDDPDNDTSFASEDDGWLWYKIAEFGGGVVEETDPVFSASPAASITETDITNWDNAYSWGNHAEAGYLTSAALSSLTDVQLTSPAAGHYLSFNGTKWINTSASGSFILNQNASAQTANYWITGNAKSGTGEIYGTYAASSGTTAYYAFTVKPTINQTGTATGNIYGIYYDPTLSSIIGKHYNAYFSRGITHLGNETSEPSGATGDIYYNSTSNKFRAYESGVWKNLIPDFASSQTIYVDFGGANSTDTRTGYSKYDFARPFNTLQAAINAATSNDVIYVKRSNTNITSSVTWSVPANNYYLTIVAESRISLANITITSNQGRLKLYNIDFGSYASSGNVRYSNQCSYPDGLQFYNCTFTPSSGSIVYCDTGVSMAGVSFYYCTISSTSTSPVFVNGVNGAYAIYISFYNSTLNAPSAYMFGGTGYFGYKNFTNSSITVAGCKDPSVSVFRFFTADLVAINSALTAVSDKFFQVVDTVVNTAGVNITVLNSTFVSAVQDYLYVNDRVQTGTSRIFKIQGNSFNNIKIKIQATISANADIYIYITGNRFGQFVLDYTDGLYLHPTIESNTFYDSYAETSDADYQVISGTVLLKNISANRTITLPDARVKGTIIRFVNTNTSGTYNWSFSSAVYLQDGTTLTTLVNGKTYELQSNGTNWYIINNV